MKKICKFATGDNIPTGAVYLCTKIQTKNWKIDHNISHFEDWYDCYLVWHYFLVEVKKKKRQDTD